MGTRSLSAAFLLNFITIVTHTGEGSVLTNHQEGGALRAGFCSKGGQCRLEDTRLAACFASSMPSTKPSRRQSSFGFSPNSKPENLSRIRQACGKLPCTPNKPVQKDVRLAVSSQPGNDPDNKTEYDDGFLARIVQGFLARLIVHVAKSKATERNLGMDKGGSKEFSTLIDAAFLLNARPGPATHELTLRLLMASFPPGFPQKFGSFLKILPLWYTARHASVITLLITQWLVGPGKVIDVDPELLDKDDPSKPGWSNTPTGWVPGFLLGGHWRNEVGAGQGVLLEKCRVLDASGCASVCANVCKVPTQQFFNEVIGLPMTMNPDYETGECRLLFGCTPPPLKEDPAMSHPCLPNCVLSKGSGTRAVEEFLDADGCPLLSSGLAPPNQ